MTALLDVKQFQIEQEYNLKLFPTYAFWRYYVIGGRLPKHTDRPSCEISATACIKKHDDWPIIIEGKSIELKKEKQLYTEDVNKNIIDLEHIKVMEWLKYFFIT